MAKLELDNVRKVYKGITNELDFTAVHGLSLAVEEGETVALLGPSGCGKSTALNMVAGLEDPTSGEVRIDGRPVTHLPAGRRNVGLVFQDYAVFTHMNTYQNLAFGLQIRHLPKSQIRAEVERIAELMGLDKVLTTPTSQLSVSELQRVAIGRTLITRPPIMLLDEPLSNLEAAMRLQMRMELRRIQAATRQTVIYVTHDQIEALSLADRIAVMEGGNLQQFGTPREIYASPVNIFVAGFIGSPPMNLFTVQSVRDRSGCVLIRPNVRLNGKLLAVWDQDQLPAGIEVWVGVRPEHLHLSDADQAQIHGEVFGVELQGADAILNVDVSGTTFRVLVPAGARVPSGERVGLTVASGHLHVFDRTTGFALKAAIGKAG